MRLFNGFGYHLRIKVAAIDGVAALNIGFAVLRAKRRQKVAQVGHRQLVMATDIDAAQEGDLNRHTGVTTEVPSLSATDRQVARSPRSSNSSAPVPVIHACAPRATISS